MSGFTIDELSVPESVDAPDAVDFVRSVAVSNAVMTEALGTPDMAYEPVEELPQYRDSFRPSRLFVARSGGEIVGRASTQTQTGDDADTSWVTAHVLPEYRGRGIGRALAERVEAAVTEDGKRKAIAYATGRDADGSQLPSPTGFGSVSADARETRFLQSRGYSLEQVERFSRLALPMPDLDERLAAAQVTSGPDYRVHTWGARTPDEWLEDRAIMSTRMSTDAPTAGLEEPEDVWTPERVRDTEDRIVASGRDRLLAAVEHVPSGHLVGFSVLSRPRQLHRAVQQYATLVLREHRGHRLGMLLKLANLDHLARTFPGHPSVLTFNAEENRAMLDVNEAVGFVEIGREGAWRKDLS
jgi:GNAT superfamily N-acetyltransferase